MRRTAIAFFFDPDGVLDEYYSYLLNSLRPFVQHIVLVVNGGLSAQSQAVAEAISDELIIRPNVDFDVGAYRDGIQRLGYPWLAEECDELLLLNHTFFGPIFPFSEMFFEMERRDDDFWGITIHKEMKPNPFNGIGVLPEHINSHFIAVRRRILQSPSFKEYWERLGPIASYDDSVIKHESRFTQHFSQLGFAYSSYIDAKKYPSVYPPFIDVDQTIEDRSPILKRRLFFHDPLFHDSQAIDLPRALRLIEKNSEYDLGLVWRNITRSTKPRVLATNAALLRVLPAAADATTPSIGKVDARRIAVCMHVFYVEMLDELLGYARNVPKGADLVVTTDTEAKARALRKATSTEEHFGSIQIRVVKENRGRDVSALLITCGDLFQDDRYDLVCKLHTKKSPQIEQTKGRYFKRYLLENLLPSEGYVRNVIRLFESPWVGMAFPPPIHIGFPTLGHAWFANQAGAKTLAKELGLRTPFDDDTPLAPYGTMFWFRPSALRSLFARRWQWSEFNAEPNHSDGSMAHVVERLFSYAAADAGYLSMQILNAEQASLSYSYLEFKQEKLMATQPYGWFLATFYHLRALSGVSPTYAIVLRLKQAISRRRALARFLTPAYRFLVPIQIRRRLGS